MVDHSMDDFEARIIMELLAEASSLYTEVFPITYVLWIICLNTDILYYIYSMYLIFWYLQMKNNRIIIFDCNVK